MIGYDTNWRNVDLRKDCKRQKRIRKESASQQHVQHQEADEPKIENPGPKADQTIPLKEADREAARALIASWDCLQSNS